MAERRNRVPGLLPEIAAVGTVPTRGGCSRPVHSDAELHLRDRLPGVRPDAPLLATGAGHNAGALPGHLPTGTLLVRDPTGVSRSPDERVEDVGADALAATLRDLPADPA